jgi:hypothetical protein
MNKISTHTKINFLQAYVKKWHKKWHAKHPENIIGFRIGKKKINGIPSRNYSIIFQVRKKKSDKQLETDTKIPKFLIVKFPDGEKRKIKTDVEQTGTFKFQTGITGKVNSSYSINYGSAGLFVTDDFNKVFMLTNYHVVAELMINNQQYYYRRQPNHYQNDVRISNGNANIFGRFEQGIISHHIDAAFVELFIQPHNGMNMLPDGNKVNGRISTRPYPISFIGKLLTVYSFHNKEGRNGIINSNSFVLYTGHPDFYFQDIIQITPRITKGGDVLTPNFAVLGLIIGADDYYSYAIPFYKINDFKNIYIP